MVRIFTVRTLEFLIAIALGALYGYYYYAPSNFGILVGVLAGLLILLVVDIARSYLI